jgi:hypothetical protein
VNSQNNARGQTQSNNSRFNNLNQLMSTNTNESNISDKKFPNSVKHKDQLFNGFKSNHERSKEKEPNYQFNTNDKKTTKFNEMNISSRVIDLTSSLGSSINSSNYNTTNSNMSTLNNRTKSPNVNLNTFKTQSRVTNKVSAKEQPAIFTTNNTNSTINNSLQNSGNSHSRKNYNQNSTMNNTKKKSPEKKIFENKQSGLANSSSNNSTPSNQKEGKNYNKSNTQSNMRGIVAPANYLTNQHHNLSINSRLISSANSMNKDSNFMSHSKNKNQVSDFACCTINNTNSQELQDKLLKHCESYNLLLKEVKLYIFTIGWTK